MSILPKLNAAERLIGAAKEELENAPEKDAIIELLETVQALDYYYREEYLKEYADWDGLTVQELWDEGGVDCEFYIEASTWHDISVALSKIKLTK